MGLFSKKGDVGQASTIRSVPTHMDGAWFENYLTTILHDSSVGSSDPQDRYQLELFTGYLLDDWAGQWFTQMNDTGAASAFENEVSGSLTPLEEKVQFLAGWNQDSIGFMETNFAKYEAILTKAGKDNGKMRFFTSKCCGKPLEFDLETDQVACSACGKRNHEASGWKYLILPA